VASMAPWVFTGKYTPDEAIKEMYAQLSDYKRA